MTISAKEVQELRKISGAGMMECKTALSDANGDLDQAFKILREKGIAKAGKKSLRDANEGLIGVMVENETACIVEVNSETDFVSRNSEFHSLLRSILEISMKNIDDHELIREKSTDLINTAVGKIGENIVLKRINSMRGKIFSYVHNSISEGLGKIGVLVKLDTNMQNIDEIGKNICMHIAALSPRSISVDDLDKEIIENERNIISQQLKETGKPDNIVEKMLVGKLKKFTDECTLLGQKFVIDQSINVREYLESSAANNNDKITIKEFIRFEIGS